MKDFEVMTKLHFDKYEEEVDILQKFMRDVNLKFKDC